MLSTTSTKFPLSRRRVWLAVAAALFTVAMSGAAAAQEILLTGPLAGAPAVRKLRLYREGRFEVGIGATFTLLDEYQREIFISPKFNYNLTDWLAIGIWGGFSPKPLHLVTSLSEQIQDINKDRQSNKLDADGRHPNVSTRLTEVNMGPDFTKQLGSVDWIAAPHILAVPFRGKLALFEAIYVDTDFYVFLGPAFAGVTERADCETNCPGSFGMTSGLRIAPTFGLGFNFYTNKWNAFTADWRGMPFKRNTGGFDNHGRDPEARFPDGKVNSDDLEFKFNQLVTVGYTFFFPTDLRVSE